MIQILIIIIIRFVKRQNVKRLPWQVLYAHRIIDFSVNFWGTVHEASPLYIGILGDMSPSSPAIAAPAIIG